MSEATRYESTLCDGADFDGQGHVDCGAGLVEQPDGDWVLYDDFREAVLAETERCANLDPVTVVCGFCRAGVDQGCRDRPGGMFVPPMLLAGNQRSATSPRAAARAP